MAVRRRLIELEPAYREERARRSREQMRSVAAAELDPSRRDSRDASRVWDEMQQYRPLLPPLHLYTVPYPRAVVHVVPPRAAVLGGVDAGLGDQDIYEVMVLAAAGRA